MRWTCRGGVLAVSSYERALSVTGGIVHLMHLCSGILMISGLRTNCLTLLELSCACTLNVALHVALIHAQQVT